VVPYNYISLIIIPKIKLARYKLPYSMLKYFEIKLGRVPLN